MAAMAGELRSGWLWRSRLSTGHQKKTTGLSRALFGSTSSRSSILTVTDLVSGLTIVGGPSLIPKMSAWVGIWLPMRSLSFDVVRFGPARPVRRAKRRRNFRSGR
jgi:hypothetical protein